VIWVAGVLAPAGVEARGQVMKTIFMGPAEWRSGVVAGCVVGIRFSGDAAGPAVVPASKPVTVTEPVP
jgi:hypothetical protein